MVMSCSGSSCGRSEDGAEVRNPTGVRLLPSALAVSESDHLQAWGSGIGLPQVRSARRGVAWASLISRQLSESLPTRQATARILGVGWVSMCAGAPRGGLAQARAVLRP